MNESPVKTSALEYHAVWFVHTYIQHTYIHTYIHREGNLCMVYNILYIPVVEVLDDGYIHVRYLRMVAVYDVRMRE